MAVTEHHEEPFHYLFNTSVIEVDVSIFEPAPASANAISTSGRGTVFFKSLPVDAGNLQVVVKKYQRGGLVRHFNKSLYWHAHYTQSRVWREFKLLTTMCEMGLPVPEPVAGRVKYSFARWYESTIITREIEQAATLAELLHPEKNVQPEVEAELWRKTGRTIQRLHTANVYHADLNANNILIDKQTDIYLIDFDKGRFRSDNTSNWKKENLQRLQRSLLKQCKLIDQFRFSPDDWNELISGYNEPH